MEKHSPASPDLQLLSQAFTASINGIVIVDAQQRDMPLIYVNPAFERLSGYVAAEIIGRNCRFLVTAQHMMVRFLLSSYTLFRLACENFRIMPFL